MPTADGQLTAAELAQIYALVQAQAAIRQQLTQIAINGVLVPFRALANWYDSVEITLAALQALRIIQPAQRRMAEVTDAYLARVLTTMTGRPHRPIGAVDITRLRRELTQELVDAIEELADEEIVPAGELNIDRLFRDPGPGVRPRGDRPIETVTGGSLLNDPRPSRPTRAEVLAPDAPVPERTPAPWAPPPIRTSNQLRQTRPADMVEVYSRVAAEYRYRVSRGEAVAKAKEAALERARVLAETDIAMAGREQEHEVLRQVRDHEITGWRRILRPELSNTGTSCGLCIVAADRVYHREELKPIHAHCHCEVLPIRGLADPGLQLNREDLDRLYKAAGGSRGGGKRQEGALKYVRAVITEDGELGPILAEKPESKRNGQGRRTARQAIGSKKRGRTLTPEERLPGLLANAEKMRSQYEAGEKRLALALAYYDRLIDEVRQEMARV